MRTVDPEQHHRRRVHIIESAVGLFATKGFAATTTADICRAAGISTGSLFHYFPSKQAVFHALWELDVDEWERFHAATAAEPDAWTGLMAVVDKLAADARGAGDGRAAGRGDRPGAPRPGVRRRARRQRTAASWRPGRLVRRLRGAGRADPDLPDLEATRWVLTLDRRPSSAAATPSPTATGTRTGRPPWTSSRACCAWTPARPGT